MCASRYNGRFCKKNVAKWKNNLINSHKRRKEESQVSPELSGRRIFDVKLLAKELWCYSCQKPLTFRNTVNELRSGLSSIFDIKCKTCLKIHRVHTSTSEPNSGTRPTYTVNSKIVTGAIEGGIGNTHLNKILSAADLPVMHFSTFKRNERKVGEAIEELAAESCLKNLQAERELTIEREGLRELKDWAEEDIVKLTISYDVGWQKKGSGRSYNSLTGHGTAIGFYTSKVIGYTTRNKRCSTCELFERAVQDTNNNTDENSINKERHDCRKNVEGSSKAMEADMAREIFLQNPHFDDVRVQLGTLIGDDDSSTLSTLRSGANYEIKKWSDKNHVICKLSKCLYAIKLSTPLIKYLKYCFACVLEKNKNDVEATREGILNITPHAFNDHAKCGDWCSYQRDPDNYEHKILPGGKGLSDTGLRQKLENIFHSFANVAEKLSPCASSQSNESLNRIIASKAPKQLHYGGSSSNDIRVGSAILHKNVGNTSIQMINQKMDNSPSSKMSTQYRLQQDAIAHKRKLKAQTVQFKRRRRQLSNLKSNQSKRVTRKEGICYESGYGLDIGIDFVDRPDTMSVQSDLSSAEIVYFDLETTGLGTGKEIIQIAAQSAESQFDVYIMPSDGISVNASEVTGLTICNGNLCYQSTPVITLSKEDAAKSFMQYLKSIGNKIILLAHNCFRFDCPTILEFVKRAGHLDKFLTTVVGFADSLPIFKAKLKNKRGAKASYAQVVLANEFLNGNTSASAHNAINDVDVLRKLIEHSEINITREDILMNVKDVPSIISEKSKKIGIDNLKQSLQCLKYEPSNGSGLSNHIINKIASAGMTMENIKQSFLSSGPKRIYVLLAQDVNGKPRITKNKKIIESLCKKLNSLVAED